MGRPNEAAQHQAPAGTELQEDHPSRSGVRSPTPISGRMSSREIIDILISRGVPDITDRIDISSSSEFPVASGGRSDIYRGYTIDGSAIAIKCIRLSISREDVRPSFKLIAHELYIWSKCRHPNVLELIGMAQFRGQIALISPWMDGGSITSNLRNSSTSRYDLCVQVAGAVTYLHQMGIVHGDIKGANILVSGGKTVKLSSFGSAKMSGYSLQFSNSQSVGAWSIRWSAPEFLLGESERPTLPADVYSLGMTILEIFTGSVPYEGLSEPAVLYKLISGARPTRPEQILPVSDDRANSLWTLLQNCWDSDPAARPTAQAVWERMKVLAGVSKDA